MKKRLLGILLIAVIMVTLLPVTAHAAEHYWVSCEVCNKKVLNSDAGKYEYADGTYCRYTTTCPTCNSKLVSTGLFKHQGSGTPTCTTGIICDLCGSEFGVLGHDWKWTSNGDGTHTRTCQREGCGLIETVNCSGGTATCTEKAVCKDCGAEYGEKDLNNHTGGTATCTKKAVCQRCKQEYGDFDLNNHSVIPATCIAPATCRDCRKELEPINPDKHSGGEATCVAKAICVLCKKEYGEIDPDNHDYEVTEFTAPTCLEPGSATFVCKHDSSHTYTQTIPVTGHRFYNLPWKEVSTAEGSGIELECDMCHVREPVPLYVVECKAGETYTDNKTVSALIDLVSWSSKYRDNIDFVGEDGFTVKNSAGKLIFSGEIDSSGVSAFHVAEGVTSEDGDTVVVWSDNAEPEYGIKCVFLSDHTHKAANPSKWESDGTEHWQVCSCGEKLNKAAHNGGTATCQGKATCMVCGQPYGELGTHSFTKETVNAKYLKSAATCTEKAVYYKSCAACGAKGTETFEDGNALDHDWGAWTSNGDGTHTRVCKRDESHTETANCSGGTATCTEKATCTDCGKEYGDKDPANHTGKKEWTVTKTKHEQKWSCCGEVVVAKESHTFGKWVVTKKETSRQDGEKTRTCEVCDYVETAKIPATGTSPKTGDDSHIGTWAGILCVSLAGIVALVVLYRKKHKK